MASDNMKKLIQLMESAPAKVADEELDEMFFYPDTRSREEKNRDANKPQDILGRRPEQAIAKHGKEYKAMKKGTSPQDAADRERYGLGGPKGKLPEDAIRKIYRNSDGSATVVLESGAAYWYDADTVKVLVNESGKIDRAALVESITEAATPEQLKANFPAEYKQGVMAFKSNRPKSPYTGQVSGLKTLVPGARAKAMGQLQAWQLGYSDAKKQQWSGDDAGGSEHGVQSTVRWQFKTPLKRFFNYQDSERDDVTGNLKAPKGYQDSSDLTKEEIKKVSDSLANLGINFTSGKVLDTYAWTVNKLEFQQALAKKEYKQPNEITSDNFKSFFVNAGLKGKVDEFKK